MPARVLHYVAQVTGEPEPETASRAIYDAVLETSAAGTRTPDLGGEASTSEFTDETIARVKRKLGP